MTETVRFGLIAKEDLSIGTGSIEARLADGRVVTLTQIRLTDFLSALTVGSVLFVKSGGVAGEDNANIFYDDTNNRLGIGTASPGTALHVVGAIIGTTTLGPTASQQHTLPAVASDTYVLLAASQTLTNKTLSGAVISGAAPATPTSNVLYADSVVKGWVRVDVTAGVPAIIDDLNVSSITDNGVGDFTVNWATPFPNATYAAVAMAGVDKYCCVSSQSASTLGINVRDAAGALADPNQFFVIAIGD